MSHQWTAAPQKCRAVWGAGNEHLEKLATGFQTLSGLTEVVCTQQECTINDTLEHLWLKARARAAPLAPVLWQTAARLGANQLLRAHTSIF